MKNFKSFYINDIKRIEKQEQEERTFKEKKDSIIRDILIQGVSKMTPMYMIKEEGLNELRGRK